MTTPSNHRDGLVFKKLDLHLHTPASQCFADKSVTTDQILQEALKRGLDGIAVTDHNSGAWVNAMKKAAGKKLVVFPGVELTCASGKEGIHIIALFDPSSGTAEVEILLGNLGLKPAEYGNIKTVVQKDPIDVARIVHDRGGLVVLAHADSTRGVLADMRGQQRINLIQCLYVNAAEGTDFRDDGKKKTHKRVVDLLDGTDPEYKRKLAVYQASDNPSGNNDGQHALAGIGTRCAFFKLDQINLQGMRQCFADPDVRIRQDFEFTEVVYPRIRSIKVTGGFLEGQEAVFHGGLNSIIGAKGTGKSLLIEFLRFGLNQPPGNEGIRADHEAKLASRLENYGYVEITLSDETGQEFTIRRTYDPADDHPYTGDAYDIDQLFPVLFLSQNEIIKIAENEDEQIAFLDRFLDFRSYHDEIAEYESQLKAFDGQLAEGFRAFPESRQVELSIATATKEIEHLDNALTNPAFDTFAKHDAKDRAIREQGASLKTARETVERFATTASQITTGGVPSDLSNDPILKRLQDLNKDAKAHVISVLAEISGVIARKEQAYEAEYAKWAPTYAAAKKQYDDEVKKGGGDYKNLAQKRAKRVRDVELMQQKLASSKQKSDSIKDITASRSEILGKLRSTREKFSQARKERCALIESDAKGRLRVRIQESSNVEEFRTRLMSLKRGSYLKDVEIDSICEDANSEEFIKAVLRYGVFGKGETLEALANKTDIDSARMKSLAEFLCSEFKYEQLLALEYKALPADRPEILYNVGQDHFEPLNRLSVGQKCTAMLIIALSDGTFPIVIDQPEDSLDIRSIWEDMCHKIRGNKERRQFIFTTHNSSLAVASDTDKFIIMEAEASRGQIVFSGSMDHQPISEEVLLYLEGGRDTYRAKYGKYQRSDLVE